MRLSARVVWIGVLLTSTALLAQENYHQELAAWRQQRERNLLGDNGWFTVAGLVFLKPGRNTFGTARSNDVVLPESAGATTGVLEFSGGRVRLSSTTPLAVNGTPMTSAELRAATGDRPPDRVSVGPVTFFLMLSGDRLAVRVRDQNSPLKKSFTGLRWFPANDALKVTARFEAYPVRKTAKVLNILGDLDPFDATGLVTFSLNGKTYRLEAYDLNDGNQPLFTVFKDLTSGRETYPAARYLNAARPDTKGALVLDFNKAFNPPCAYNPYTTCPLPTAQNRLNVRIEAGELDYHGPH